MRNCLRTAMSKDRLTSFDSLLMEADLALNFSLHYFSYSSKFMYSLPNVRDKNFVINEKTAISNFTVARKIHKIVKNQQLEPTERFRKSSIIEFF